MRRRPRRIGGASVLGLVRGEGGALKQGPVVALLAALAVGKLGQLLDEAAAHFGCGLFGERDGQHPRKLGGAVAFYEAQKLQHQAERLA